jgi:hypothetical protein
MPTVSGAGRWRRSRSREVASVGGDQSARRCARCRARVSGHLTTSSPSSSTGPYGRRGSRPAPDVASSVEEPPRSGSARRTTSSISASRRRRRRAADTRPGRHGRRGTARLVADGLLPTAGARRAGGTRSRLDPSRWVGAQSFRAGAARNMPGVGDLFRFSCQRETHRPSSPQREVAGSGATR